MDVCVVPDVTDVLVSLLWWSLSFVVVFRSALIGNLWNRSPFLSPKSVQAHSWTVTQEEMSFEGSQVNAPPPLSRGRMMPPTPLQNSYSSFEEEQGHFEVEDQIWSASDRFGVRVPEDSDVDFKRILEEARNEKGCAIFETFSSEGPSELLVVSRLRWDEHQRRLRN